MNFGWSGRPQTPGIRVAARSYGEAVCRFCGDHFHKTNFNQGDACGKPECQRKRTNETTKRSRERAKKKAKGVQK